MLLTKLLDKNPKGAPQQQLWNYHSMVGCLSYMQAMNWPDITMVVQQCACFCNNPKRKHKEAVKQIGWYILATRDKGMCFVPNKRWGLECFVDADWAGSWQKRSSHDSMSAHWQTGFVVMYAGCPILLKSLMQSLIALSTTEAEYIALSSALWQVIWIIHLLDELDALGFQIHKLMPKIKWSTFEDYQSCINQSSNTTSN